MDKNNTLLPSLETLKEAIGNFKRSFNLIWKASPTYTLYWASLLIIQGLLPGLIVLLTKKIVDGLVLAANNHWNWEQLRPSLIYIFVLVAAMLLTEISQSVMEMVRTAQSDIIQDYVTSLIHDKSAVLDMTHFESSAYQNRLEQATSGATFPLNLLESIGSLIQNLITLLVMAGLLINYSIWLPLILIISTLPAFIIVIRFDRNYHAWWKSTTSDRRWIQYFDLIIGSSISAAEIKVFNLNLHFQDKYKKLRYRLRTEKLAQLKKLGIAKLFSTILSLAVVGLIIGWMSWRAMNGFLTLGDLALFYQSFDRGQGIMRTLFGSINQIIKTSLFTNILFEFLDLKSNVPESELTVNPPAIIKKGIEFKAVTFRYPGCDQPVFENFSLFIPAGKSIALVGENGTGKTTLIKLLCRFYDPEEGVIEFDGIDIKSFPLKELLKMITVMFQMPVQYIATIRESIGMGDIENLDNSSAIENAAWSAGAHKFTSQLPNKYDTQLGKAFAEGIELSGGQWQKIALARAYFRKAPIVLLDEPTSLLDSWAEADWFQRFHELTLGKTALLITHRFTVAMRADLIIVMDKGQIVESGTHEELVNFKGLYAKSWEEQMTTARGKMTQSAT